MERRLGNNALIYTFFDYR